MEKAFIPVKYGIGIDMGKEKFYACVSVMDDAQRIKIKATRSFSNDTTSSADFYQWATHHCKQTSLPVHFLMEATGVYYEQLALFLHHKQAYICVILPQKAAHFVKALGIKTKTDGVDAQALATMVCQQRIDCWQPISEAMYKLRQLTRQHLEIQAFKTQIGNQLSALEVGMYHSPEVKKQLTKLLAEINQQVDECVKLIEKAIAANPDWKRKVEQICGIKGVGVLTVANLLTETNAFALFENQRQLVSYAGYDVVENQSGKRVGRTRISKRGNSRIRRALHMSALQVVRYEQKPFADLYERVFANTKIKMKGYVAVQRKLLTLIYALWKKDVKYDADFVSQVQKKVAPVEGATRHRPQVDVLERANIGELIES